MSNLSSSDEEFYDAVEKVISPKDVSNRNLAPFLSRDHLPLPSANVKSNQQEITTTNMSSSWDHSTVKIRGHKKTSSISYEEYTYGSKNRGSFPSSTNKNHSRGYSWSETSMTAAYNSQKQRHSHDSHSRPNSLLVGFHDQFHLPNHEIPPHGKPYVKVKTKIKTNKRFGRLVLAQTLAVDTTEVYATADIDPIAKIEGEDIDGPKQPVGAIWTSRFSKDGKYMATGGQSCVINVWKVLRDLDRGEDNMDVEDMLPHEPSIKVFHDAPVRIYKGHTADILDISWSKNNFLISSSMDKTVRLWHVSQKVCLCVFRHLDVVTSVKFHPKSFRQKDDRFFLSGSFDCKVRLWSIPEKRVAFWNEIPAGNMITAVGFTLDGRTACVGATTGDVFFFETQGLKYNTQILVKNYSNKRGKKVTGIEPMPGMPLGEERILVTTNDSRIWIINMKDKSFVYKYKGIENPVMQIKASFSDDGRYIICGSEDGCIYLWCTDQVNYSPFQRLQDSRIKAAVALGHLGDQMLQTAYGNFSDDQHKGVSGWLKRGERRMIDKLRSRNEHFVAHQHIVTSAIFAPTKTRQILARAGGDSIFDFTPVYTHRNSTCYNDYEDDLLDYEDAVSERRNSSASLDIKQYQDMDELKRSLLSEFSEATLEERNRFDYPDSQIIVSADLHGSIKVWRMDSGFYKHESDSAQEESEVNDSSSDTHATLFSSVSAPNSIRSNTTTEHSMKSDKTSSKRSTLSAIFSKFK